MSSVPDTPVPPHADLDSMLSRKFGKEIANYFSGSPLNRVSFLRTDNVFLSTALKHPTSSFLLFDDRQPLLKPSQQLGYVSFHDVSDFIGDNPYAKPEEELIREYNSSKYIPQLIFLGLDERRDGLVYRESYRGAPIWALDVTPKEQVAGNAKRLIDNAKSRGWSFVEGRQPLMSLEAQEAAIFAEARQLLDWNARNPFCAQCGQPTLSVNAGFKRTCPPTDWSKSLPGASVTNSATPSERAPCATRGRVSNVSFPRTDPTVIMAIVSSDGTHVLLGRQSRYPQYWYSTLAGFLEPAESVEEAVRREVWEESGVSVGRVVIHSTQPWPFPANLMIGAIGQSISEGESINLGHDAELEDAKWYSIADVQEALRVGTSNLAEGAGAGYKEGNLRLPPRTAIANQLLTAVVNGFVGHVESRI